MAAEDDVLAHITKRRAYLDLLEHTKTPELFNYWPPEKNDWAALGIFASKKGLTPKIYEDLADRGSWYVHYLLCQNPFTPERLLRQLAGLKEDAPVPASSDELYNEEDPRELVRKKDAGDIRKFAWVALKKRKTT